MILVEDIVANLFNSKPRASGDDPDDLAVFKESMR